jgi:transposase
MTCKVYLQAVPKHERQPFPEEHLDHVIDCTLTTCPICGGPLVETEEVPEKQQQIELVEKPVVITEYRGHRYWCETCKSYHDAPIPPEVDCSVRNSRPR